MQKADCEQLRREIKVIAEKLWEFAPKDARPMWSEVHSNVMIAYRHLEDASMRLGKAIQALDGGISVYDKDQVPVSGGGD